MVLFSGRKCLIVLGMHRSGTSAITGALSETGFEIGKNIMPPADENPKGFFENSSIVSLNDQILSELYVFWDDTLFIPDGWWKSEIFSGYKEKIRIILEDEYPGDKPMLVKDPRMCVLLPLYLEVLQQMGTEPAFLVCVRHPLPVARSLGRRNNMPAEKASLLWADYQFKAELYSRGFSRLFVAYDEFLSDPLQVLYSIKDKLVPEMNIPDEVAGRIGSFVDPALSNRFPESNRLYDLPYTGIANLYTIQQSSHLRDLKEDERVTTDGIRHQFENLNRFFNGMPDQYRAALTVEFENGETIVLIAPIVFGTNTLEYPVSVQKKVKKLIFRPCNAKTGIRWIEAEAYGPEENKIILAFTGTNATAKNAEKQVYIFETGLSKILFDFPEPFFASRIIISIRYLVFGPAPCRKALWRKD
ncbi:MAG TPA: hypothetical protein PLR01_12550 [Bacteroidales bacterium]|nr:hypothetical protein [Bacteroidales bacterium]